MNNRIFRSEVANLSYWLRSQQPEMQEIVFTWRILRNDSKDSDPQLHSHENPAAKWPTIQNSKESVNFCCRMRRNSSGFV